jgi:membrane associated rhomboid family serine protease
VNDYDSKLEPAPPGYLTTAGRRVRLQATIIGSSLGLIWLVSSVNLVLLGGALNQYGVRPRLWEGLWGVLWMPFLHGSFGHLAANSVPFAVLGWLVMLRRTSDFFVVTAVALVISGTGVWLTGPWLSVHIGASGLVFGYFGFLLLRGYFERSLYAILLAVFVFLLYGGLIWGVLPQQNGVSWQAHLFGFAGGALAARLLTPMETATGKNVGTQMNTDEPR